MMVIGAGIEGTERDTNWYTFWYGQGVGIPQCQ